MSWHGKSVLSRANQKLQVSPLLLLDKEPSVNLLCQGYWSAAYYLLSKQIMNISYKLHSDAAKRPKLEPENGEEGAVIKEEEVTNGKEALDHQVDHSSRNYRGYRKATPSHPGRFLIQIYRIYRPCQAIQTVQSLARHSMQSIFC